jgi:hypothetical protein
MPTTTGVAFRLYDLVADPDERTDISGDSPEIVARLREQLFAWILKDTSLVRDGDAIRAR